ncbi:metallophosphoesterase family protein [Ramlibacter sp.]|uniref:metallophosphoesterase family protein n=1 Tax=Ramlibacter sp. TaxID=1917967 RepID=UPI003D13DCA7
MSVLLHISDTHFGTEQPPVTKALRALAHSLVPDVLVLSGDITQRARAAQFEAARAFCDSLGIARVLTLPGNHDIPLYNVFARGFSPYAGYMAHFGRDLEPQLEMDDLLVVCVNTTRPSRHKDGEVSRGQIERVSGRLSGARREQLRVVVTHQPSCVMREEDEKDRLHGGHDAVRAWSAAGADLVLGGHIHLPYVSDIRTHVKDAERALYCVQAGTATSHRVRHGTPNSVNVVRWQPPAAGEARTCAVERWDYDLADDRFELTHPHELTLGA